MLTAQLVDRLIACDIARPAEILKCSEEDLREVAQKAPGPLPTSYLDFLRALGRGAGRFLPEQDVFYPHMLSLNDRAQDILGIWEEGNLKLPTNAFVFTMRYGDQFLFFNLDGDPRNSQVHHYLIEQGFFRPVGTFWGWIEEELQLAERASGLR